MKAIQIVSQTPHRVRLKVRDKDIAQEAIPLLVDFFDQVEGIKISRVNLVARSLVLEGENLQTWRELLDNFTQECIDQIEIEVGEKERVKGPDRLPEMRRRLRERLENLDLKIQDFTDGELDLDMVFGLMSMGMSVFQTFKQRKFLPPGEELLLTGLKMFMKEKAYLD
jgi:hypothetical protein